MSLVIKKVGDEVALLTPSSGDKVANAHGKKVFEAAFIFVGNLDNTKSENNKPTPKPTNKPKR
ncbi:hypothetical protein ABJY94_23545 [Vibrio parahaemolyticus]|uniref:hypothetical protein n=1 Tax=Vibrio parahaemolyticus TaxID=670 RepID=UPI001D2E53CC|nr:hypothetical protein [Vibrio parahaemolyticus]EGR1629539.1 hypothetical protein [Vibrio parahaemolyticus]EGR1649692.1 hypothetical protein [Vibrio parahaemolyticus]HCG7645025.1 hypothetical protein [Vibrio parahaemolyticus]HCH1833013.1 hypothetical protein [Vibrio parahaemolyticus]